MCRHIMKVFNVLLRDRVRHFPIRLGQAVACWAGILHVCLAPCTPWAAPFTTSAVFSVIPPGRTCLKSLLNLTDMVPSPHTLSIPVANGVKTVLENMDYAS